MYSLGNTTEFYMSMFTQFIREVEELSMHIRNLEDEERQLREELGKARQEGRQLREELGKAEHCIKMMENGG